jgi:hypothetical protein
LAKVKLRWAVIRNPSQQRSSRAAFERAGN